VSDNGFIVLLSFGAALLSGILAVAHVSAHRLKQRQQLRREKQALAEPELDFSGLDCATSKLPGFD
jgi:hypothetical protein